MEMIMIHMTSLKPSKSQSAVKKTHSTLHHQRREFGSDLSQTGLLTSGGLLLATSCMIKVSTAQIVS